MLVKEPQVEKIIGLVNLRKFAVAFFKKKWMCHWDCMIRNARGRSVKEIDIRYKDDEMSNEKYLSTWFGLVNILLHDP